MGRGVSPAADAAPRHHETAKRTDLMLDRGDDEGRHCGSGSDGAIEALQAAPVGKPH